MKIKITFLAVLFGLPIFAFAATQYAPSPAALRAQAYTDEYRNWMINQATINKPVDPYDVMNSYYMPVSAMVSPVISAPSGSKPAVIDSEGNMKVPGQFTATSVHLGKNSMYIGSDTASPYLNYIKVTGSSLANNFLRIMFGTTATNAVEKIRILANGNMGIGTATPAHPLDVVGTIKSSNIITGSINPHPAGLAIRTNDMRVSNEFCLQDGTKTPIANPYGVSDAEWLSLKCFKYACPAANGQWALSQTTCSVAVDPKPTLFLPGSTTIVNRSRQVIDDIASLEWGATAGGVSIKTLKLNFSGAAISRATSTTTTPASAFSVDLVDASTTVAWASTSQQVCSPSTRGLCSVTFSPNAVIPQGVRTKKVFVRVNSSLFTNGALQDSLSVQMNTASDITWSDGMTSSINWNPVEMPMTAANIYYP